jgi:hypothetical protein
MLYFMEEGACLYLFALSLQDILHGVLYKEQKFISLSSGGWEVPD